MYEIRNYHFKAEHIDAYRHWAPDAVAFIRTRMDVVGFWVGNDEPPEYGGRLKGEGVTPANITWIIRWESREQRDETWRAFRADPEWRRIIRTVPGGPSSYIRTEARFAEEV